MKTITKIAAFLALMAMLPGCKNYKSDMRELKVVEQRPLCHKKKGT